jgi:phage-related protein
LYRIVFYKDKRGKEPVFDYIKELESKGDKDSRVNAAKINDYIQILSIHGTGAGEPYVKHLDGEIWELRPIRNRILFAAWSEGKFILLHYFIKKTQKTPPSEIARAKRALADYQEQERLGKEESK